MDTQILSMSPAQIKKIFIIIHNENNINDFLTKTSLTIWHNRHPGRYEFCAKTKLHAKNGRNILGSSCGRNNSADENTPQPAGCFLVNRYKAGDILIT